jgi:flagellar biosynthetic protein FliQ
VSPESVIDLMRGALQLMFLLLSIVLLPSLGVGLVVSMFQAATQINETTLSFVPKLLVVLLTLLLTGPWMLRVLTDYTHGLYDGMSRFLG